MKLSPAVRLSAASAAALLVLSLFGGMSVNSIRDQRAAANLQDHTLRVLNKIEEVRLALLRPEMGRAGHLLTDRELPLPAVADVRADLLGKVAELRDLTADNAAQQERLDRLQPLLNKRLEFFEETLHPDPQRADARQAQLTHAARDLDARIESILEEMRGHEVGLLHERELATERSRTESLWVTGILGALAVAFLATASVLLWRELDRRRSAQEELTRMNESLDRRVRSESRKVEESNKVLLVEVQRARAAETRVREQAELLNRVHEAIIIAGPDRKVRYWNQGAERLYGLPTADCLGKDVHALLASGRTTAEQLAAIDAALRQSGEWNGELTQQARDGKALTVDSHWSLVRDTEGAPRGTVILNIDNTEKAQLHRQFLRAQRIESIGTLAGGIAHDLNNVLTPILMAVKLLQKDRPNLDRKGLLATAEASSLRGAEMVKQLLAFAGGVQGERHPLHLKAVVHEVRALLAHTLPKSINLEVTVPADLWQVQGDPTQLAQVVMNLCVNARDAMPAGGTLRVLVANVAIDDKLVGLKHPDAKAGPYVCLTVSDTGTGIAPDVLDKIFDPFFTTKEQGKGTGLGLSTAVGIVKSHGGFLQVYTEVDHGTRMTVYLPATQQDARHEGRTNQPAPAGAGELILVVDDEQPILSTTSGLLTSSGYQALTAESGTKAVELFSQHRTRVRAVLLDMMMPGMDGPATLRALRALDPQVPIIACSGLNTSGRVGEVMAAGAFAFLQKPYSDEALLHTLHQVCHAGRGLAPLATGTPGERGRG